MAALPPTADRAGDKENEAMVKWLAAALLALPLLEIATFIAAGASLGFLRAFGLLVVTTLLGLIVLRQAGAAARSTLRDAMARRNSADAVTQVDALKVLAGILLVVPGFLTDVAGLVLLVPPVRHALARRLLARFSPQAQRRRDGVIDLDPEDWRPVPERVLPETPVRRPDRTP